MSPFAVDYLAGGKRYHTVVMAPNEILAARHVRAARNGCTIMNVDRLKPRP
jgi:RecG-like helicase